MAAKRLLIVCVLAALSMLTGCRTWCDHHYPCQQSCQPCQPCCCAPQANVPPPPPPAQVNNFQGSSNCCCTTSRQPAAN